MIEAESRCDTRAAQGSRRLTLDLPAAPNSMTRCECAETSFEEAARRAGGEALSAEEIVEFTGCGGNCTACLPDLMRYLASRALPLG